MEEDVAEFIAALLHSATITHFMHFSSDSYSKHKALGKFYRNIVNLVDKYSESYMGHYGQIKKFPNDFHSQSDPLMYLISLKNFVFSARQDLPKDTELQNIIDEIADLINSTLFKLEFLK